MDKILEQDLEPIEGEVPAGPELPNKDLDLEPLPGEDNEGGDMGDVEYQYTLTVKQDDTEGEQNLEPTFTFVLTPREAEGEEENGELESIEDTSAGIESAQAPQPSVPAAPPALPESVWKDFEPITEQEAVLGANGGDNTPPPATPAVDAMPAPTDEVTPESEPELDEVEPVEINEENLKAFLEGADIELKFSIDEETEFSLEESIDFLKAYPETEVFVTVKGDVEEFKEKLDEFLSGQEEKTAEAGTEEQNMMVDNQGESLDLKNTPTANPATPQVHNESFAIFNIRDKKNLPDGIYIGHLKENKLYGRIDVKLTTDKLIIDKDIFDLAEKVDIKEAREQSTIELSLKEADVKKFVTLLDSKADIKVNL